MFKLGVAKMILPAISLGHLIMDFYINILASILPFLALYLGLSLTSLGLMLTIMLITTGLAQPIFGFIIDKKKKRLSTSHYGISSCRIDIINWLDNFLLANYSSGNCRWIVSILLPSIRIQLHTHN